MNHIQPWGFKLNWSDTWDSCRKQSKGLHQWPNIVPKLKGKAYIRDKNWEGNRSWLSHRKGKDVWGNISHGEEATIFARVTCYRVPFSLPIKRVWTDVLPVVGSGCGGGAWNLELGWFISLWVKRVVVPTRACSVSVCLCGWVCLSVSPSLLVPHSQALPWIFSDPLGPFPHAALMCVPRAWMTRKF